MSPLRCSGKHRFRLRRVLPIARSFGYWVVPKTYEFRCENCNVIHTIPVWFFWGK